MWSVYCLLIVVIKTHPYHKEYAILKDYEEDWPTHNMLKLC